MVTQKLWESATSAEEIDAPFSNDQQTEHSFLPSTIVKWNSLNFDANGCNSLTMHYSITNYQVH